MVLRSTTTSGLQSNHEEESSSTRHDRVEPLSMNVPQLRAEVRRRGGATQEGGRSRRKHELQERLARLLEGTSSAFVLFGTAKLRES